MEYIKNTLEFSMEEPSAITLGKFDGLHRGHELLMENLLEIGTTKKIKTIVFTFDVPPKTRVDGNVEANVLTTNEEKKFVFERQCIDALIECPFTKEVMCMQPVDFIAWIVKKLTVRYIIVGKDFGFGYKRSGNYVTLIEHEEEFGYKTIVLDKIKEDDRDISSTFVREEIAKGNIEKANHLLGYPYFIRSTVVHGKQIGRTMGIPTINMVLPADKLLPPNGVYVTRVLIGEESYAGVTNVGCKPTIEGKHPVGVETYILDFCNDLYEQEVVVEFLSFVRPERRFDSLSDLKHQIASDIAYTRRYYINVT